jgi:hypothetical protein
MIDELGFYTVGTEKFYEKIHAMFRSQQLKQEMSWNFNDEVFSSIDWTIEPTLSLDQLYAMRAKQIREEYDYVLLFCSGGADSTNMFYSFVRNGLHVDEVVGSAPISGLRDWKSDPNDYRVENTIDETFHTQIPWLKQIEVEFPRTKVTLHDYFDDMLAYKADDWLLKGNDWMHPTMAGRYNLDRYPHLKRIAESGKRIAVVQGIDKPKIHRHKDNFYLVFYDNVYNNKYDSVNHPNTNPVFFYHSPKLPELIVKQAHVTARFLMQPENKHLYDVMQGNDQRALGDGLKISKLLNPPNPGVYERGIVPAIYPSLTKISFQAGKPDRMFLGRHDDWFYQLHADTRIWDMMQSDLANLIKSLDNKFLLKDEYRGLLGFRYWRKYYKIGPVSNFAPTINDDIKLKINDDSYVLTELIQETSNNSPLL